jgi:hypothetical protein
MSNADAETTEIVIREILASFNFVRVQRVMSLLDWTWYFDGVPRIPTVSEMKETAVRLLREVARTPSCAIQSGGFMAQHAGGSLSLLFTVATADCQYPDAGALDY